MRTLTILALLTLTTAVSAQDNLKILPDTIKNPEKLLYNHLLAECQKHFEARKKEVAALKTPADIKARQAKLKARFIEALGGFPKKTPLNPQVTGKIDKDDYTIEKVIYESQPNHHVTANLYLPQKAKAPYPGVLVPCGHSANGKAAEAYQRICILLAKHGMAVLCYDPIGQGERIQLLDKKGKPAIPGSTSEHTMVGVGALLVGKSTATYRIWDGIRSLDYLASRPEVDPKRLGCTGNSGGGTLTSYLMALDERIVCAAPSCYITSLEKLFKTIGPQDAEQNIPGQVAFGMDHADYLTMRAPLPTLVCVATQDFFDIDGAWASYREAKLIYGMMGAGHKISLFEYNDKHGFSKPRREAACQWMKRWLVQRDEDIVEPDFPVCTDAELQCTRTGQVLSDFNGKSVFHLNAERAKELTKHRETWLAKEPKIEVMKKIRELIGKTPEPTGNGHVFSIKQKIQRKGFWIESKAAAFDFGCTLPLMTFTPEKEKEASLRVVYVTDSGIAVAAGENGTIERLVLKGQSVLATDLRGFGWTSPKKDKGGMVKYFGPEWQEASLSLHLAQPLLGQRVFDCLQAVGLKKHEGEFPIERVIYAVGATGPAVLHAALFSENIKQVTIENSVASWEDVVHTPISVNQFANVVPGALAYYDLPDLAAMIAPRPLTIKGALNAAGNPVGQEQLEKVYQKARAAYEKAGAAKNLVLEAAP